MKYCVVLLFLALNCQAQFIKVIDSAVKGAVSNDKQKNKVSLLTTKKLSFCFRSMNLRELNMKQLWMTLDGPGFCYFGFSNPKVMPHSYIRMIQFCQARVSGKWTSMCFTMELIQATQKITHYQGGQLCYNQSFSNDSIKWTTITQRITCSKICKFA